MEAVRAARANLRYHLRYIGHLIGARNWLAGDRLTYADLAAAAHLSCIDYLGDAQWDENETAKTWYARMKSRPSFRPLLAERLPGMAPSVGLRRSRLLTRLREKARALGFDACRVTSADPPAAGARASRRLARRRRAWRHDLDGGDLRAAGRSAQAHGRRQERRHAGPQLWPDGDPLAALERPDAGAISVYARHRDYHDVIKGKLKELAAFIVAAARPEKADVKVFVDTAPLMEKPLAARAGLGWQGKHTNLVSREFGSWLFLGAILTNLDLPPDPPETDHCGQCRACLDVCPTGAFPGALSARRAALHFLPHDRA